LALKPRQKENEGRGAWWWKISLEKIERSPKGNRDHLPTYMAKRKALLDLRKRVKKMLREL